MNNWIFQGNPDVFDIDTYLINNNKISWSVRQKHLASKMAPGDQVFLWRASGSDKRKSGIVANGFLKSYPQEMEDDAASQGLWKKPPPERKELAVLIELVDKCVDDEEILGSDRIKNNEKLANLRIFRMRSETSMPA